MELLDSDIRMEVYRGTGKGGQKRNKTSSAVRLIHEPTGIVTASEAERSQWLNRQTAFQAMEHKLRELEQRKLDGATNSSRQTQVNSERSGKTFTHNEQRDEVVCHSSGRKWRMKDFKKGKLE